MSSTSEFTERLRTAAARIRADAPSFGPERLTDPDTPSGERWDRGQVLAHTAEMLPYWLAQVEMVLAAGGNGAPFGRTKADAGRIAAIEEDRAIDVEELLDRVDEGVGEVVMSMRRLTPADLACTGRHPTRGVMTVSQIIEEFIVNHLEEHADQLLPQTADDDSDEDSDEDSDDEADAQSVAEVDAGAEPGVDAKAPTADRSGSP